MVLWEKWKLSNIQSTLFLHQREVVPSSYFTLLNFEKNIRINIFITIQYLHFYLIPLNLRVVSSVVSPHSLSRSSYLRSLSPVMSLVALLCIFSSIYMSFLRCGFHACMQYYKWGLTIALYRGTIKLFSLYVIFLRIIPRTWLPLDAAILHCSETFMLAFIVTPKAFFLHGFT